MKRILKPLWLEELNCQTRVEIVRLRNRRTVEKCDHYAANQRAIKDSLTTEFSNAPHAPADTPQEPGPLIATAS